MEQQRRIGGQSFDQSPCASKTAQKKNPDMQGSEPSLPGTAKKEKMGQGRLWHPELGKVGRVERTSSSAGDSLQLRETPLPLQAANNRPLPRVRAGGPPADSQDLSPTFKDSPSPTVQDPGAQTGCVSRKATQLASTRNASASQTPTVGCCPRAHCLPPSFIHSFILPL